MSARWLHDPATRDAIAQLVEHLLDSDECRQMDILIDGLSGGRPLSRDEARAALQQYGTFAIEATLVYATVTDFLMRARLPSEWDIRGNSVIDRTATRSG